MNYSKGTYIKDKMGWYFRIIEELGEIRFRSEQWGGPEDHEEHENASERWVTVAELKKRGYVEVSPEEATGRKERWMPELNEQYWYPVTHAGFSVADFWYDNEMNNSRKNIVGVFKTKEESDAKLARILEAIKSIPE